MKIAIASGKGGTGKTTVAVNLAILSADKGQRVTYADCDVEEPNGHLFLRPTIENTRKIGVPTPEVNPELCDGCGKCGEICRFSAIVVIVKKVLTFPELCHGCGGCSMVCPLNAIEEKPREIGVVETGAADGINYVAGKLKIGQPSATPLIREVKRSTGNEQFVIFDAPPGTSCPVIETMQGVDYVLLVTEPTPFGLNDLKLAVETARILGLPHGVVLNRAGSGDNRVNDYCRAENIDLIAEIPDDRRIAESYSRGIILTHALPEYQDRFREILDFIARKGKQL